MQASRTLTVLANRATDVQKLWPTLQLAAALAGITVAELGLGGGGGVILRALRRAGPEWIRCPWWLSKV